MASSFAALRNHQFRLLWVGMGTTAFGGGVQQFALGWLLVQLAVGEGHPERAALYIGLVGVSRGVPGLMFGLLGGVFADRWDRRRVLVITRSAGSLFTVALALLVLTDHVHIAAVMLLNGLGAIADSMELPLRHSLVRSVLEPRDLVGAQGVMASTFNLTQIVAPLTAGLLIGPIGIGGLVLVTAAASLVAVAALAGLEPMPTARASEGSVFRSLGDGLLFVLREPVVRWAVVLSAVASTFVRPLQNLMPAIAENGLHVGTTELSLLLAMTSVGGVLGALGSIVLGGWGRQGRTMVLLVVVWGVLNAVFALQQDLEAALILAMLPSICWSAFAALCQVLIQRRTPERLAGRAMSLYAITLSAFVPLGTLILGSLGTLLGVQTAVVVGGLVATGIALYAFASSPALRRADNADGVPAV